MEFDENISGYNGAVGSFGAVVKMGPVKPPQCKDRLPQYDPNKDGGVTNKSLIILNPKVFLAR